MQEAGNDMEPFEVNNNGRQVMVKLAGEKVLTFLQKVFDLEAVEATQQGSEPEVVLEKGFVVELKQPQYFGSRSEALRLVRDVASLGCMREVLGNGGPNLARVIRDKGAGPHSDGLLL